MEILPVSHLCLNTSCSKEEAFSKSPNIEGIYAWGYTNDNNQFIPIYVGKSRNIHERIIQHYSRFRGGEYLIPKMIHKTTLPDFGYSIDRVTIYEPKDLSVVYCLHNTENEYKKNQKYILSNFRFLYYETNQRIIGEKYLGNKIGPERLISSVPSLNIIPDAQLSGKIDAIFGLYYKK